MNKRNKLLFWICAGLSFIVGIFLSGFGRELHVVTGESLRNTIPVTMGSLQAAEPKKNTNLRILTPQAENIDFALYSEGIFIICCGYYGFMRSDGTEITEYIYDYAYPFSEGLACVRIDGKYGFIDTSGAVALPLIYDNATPFLEGLAYFEQGDVYGFIKQNGSVAFLLDCDSVSSFREGRAFFFADGKYGYIDTSGNAVISPAFDDAGFFMDGLAKVRVGNLFGIIDKDGVFVVPPTYADITVSGEYFKFYSDNKVGILDNNGEMILPPEYSQVDLLPGLDAAIVTVDGGEKIMRLDGTAITPEVYESLYYDAENGLICARADGKYGHIDASGNAVIPLIYNYAGSFVGEFAAVGLDGKYGVIDKGGAVIMPFDSDSKTLFANGTIRIYADGKYRLADINGNSMNNLWFDWIEQSGDGYMIEYNGKHGFLDANGKGLLAPTYDYFFDDVLGADNCFIGSSGYSFGSYSIVFIGEPQSTDLSRLLLRNEITPKIKQFSQFLKEGFFEYESLEGGKILQTTIISLNDFIHFYKLYAADDGIPVMYYYTRPLRQHMFEMSYSGFYSLKDNELATVVTGYECGGSMGGDFICFWRDNLTGEVYLGSFFHVGGFGGYMGGGTVYQYSGDSAVPMISFEFLSQSLRYYVGEGELPENVHMMYDGNGAPYTKDTILKSAEDGGGTTEYWVNDKQTTIEEYRAVADRYSMLRLWSWFGY